jgi:hypothetical protein
LCRRNCRRRADGDGGFCDRADLARDFSAFLDSDLAVPNLARDTPCRVDDELLAGGQLAFERAADLRDVDADGPGENPVLRDLDDAAVHRSFDAAFDHERVAVGDFDAFELDVRTDDETATSGFLALLRLCLLPLLCVL